MPYFVHRKGTGLDTSLHDMLTDRAQAHKYATGLTLRDGIAYMVSFQVSVDEANDWHNREQNRFDNGDYLAVPWDEKELGDGTGHVGTCNCRTHFVHLSTLHPGMVAYTPSDEHGVQDRQVRLKPGKYLAEFYETPGYMTHQDVQAYVTQCQIVEDNQKLSIARTPEDIVKVYEGQEPAPLSCMVRAQGHLKLPCTVHPCEVYGNSDLAVAYYGPIDAVKARAIVWPDKLRYSRVYGTRSGGHVGINGERLKTLLRTAGYTSGSIHGAKVRHIDYKGAYLMPYIDSCDYAEDIGGGFIKLGDGDISTMETCGYAHGNRQKDNDEDEDDNMSPCEHCGTRYNEDDEGGNGYCRDCCDSMWTCEACDTGEHFGDYHSVNNEVWCQSCYDEAHQTCQNDGCTHMWIEVDIFDDEQTVERTARKLLDLCQECASKYAWCEDCEVSYDEQACPTCDRAPRCEKTIDLLRDAAIMCRLQVLYHGGNWVTCHFNNMSTPMSDSPYHLVKARFEDLSANNRSSQYRIVYATEVPINASL